MKESNTEIELTTSVKTDDVSRTDRNVRTKFNVQRLREETLDKWADNCFLRYSCTRLSFKTLLNARHFRFELSDLRKSLMRKTYVERIFLTSFVRGRQSVVRRTVNDGAYSTSFTGDEICNSVSDIRSTRARRERHSTKAEEIYRRENVGPFKWRQEEISFNAECKTTREEKDVGCIGPENKSLQRIIRKCLSPCVPAIDGISYLMN